jgi:cyclopropane-fatty-acyl-phospholipid synthase
VSHLVSAIHAGSNGSLVVDNIENIGPHYTKTLRLWKEKFLATFDQHIKPALLKEHPDMTKYDVNVFKRKWEYYFTYCEAGFATKTLGDVIITVGREGAVEMMEDVPL